LLKSIPKLAQPSHSKLDAIAGRDYPLIMGMTFIIATVILLANLITDVAYAFIDPRIRYG